MTTPTTRRRAGAIAISAALALGGLAACTSDGGDGASPDGDETTGSVIGEGDAYEATIRRTTGGVPHITGETIADAAFGQGFASGEDRTCDLADQVVKIRGERARWFGRGDDDANLNSDIQWRTIGIYDRAIDDWADQPAENRELFEAYAAGWNAHLADVGTDGVAGWCQGAEWVRELDPEEVYAYARSIALNASGTRAGAYIATAQPPVAGEGEGQAVPGAKAPAPTSATGIGATDAAGTTTAAPAGAIGALAEAPIASNGWAIGSERSTSGGGMLVANPHFPWEGELRFWEVHLTVPGVADAYGVQLSGVPGIGIGFTSEFGWTHTVSAGNRLTAYSLDLVPGDPTSYVYGDETRQMTSKDLEIEVLGDDGDLETVTHTSWSSHYGPILDFPGFGWTADATITYRDANIDDDEFIDQYFGMLEAKDFDEFQQVHAEANGVPLFNTIATSADGRAWYADTSATPDLSDEAIAAYDAALETDPVTQVAAQNGVVLLDGSDPTFEWVEEDGARDPGLVPFADQPQVEREDYVFNANDSFWMPHATELLEGDYSPLHGRQGTARSPRTRENASVLSDTSADGPSGEDGTFDLDELADAALLNEGFTARALRAEVVDRCEGVDEVTVPEVSVGEDGNPGLPGGTVDISAACDVLATWDGIYDLDSAGAPLWRELLSRFSSSDLTEAGDLWAEPFDPADPLGTPSGLARAGDGERADLALERLAYAVQALDAAGFAPDVTLGEAQFALRDGERIPIHGGNAFDGTTNVVGFGSGASIRDPKLLEQDRERLVDGSQLSTLDGETGYPVNNGTSFLMALAFTDDGPQAKVFLTYSNTEDRSADDYTEATRRFSEKDWRPVAFTEEDVAADTRSTITVRG